MLNSGYAIVPKDSNGPLRVLMIGRISTEHQSLENIEASYEFARSYLTQLYKGTLQIKTLGERGSGMLKDRETIREAEDEIETGTWDLVIMEDLARAYRNTQYQIGFVQHCADHDTRLISIGDALDTADPNWQAILHVAVVRHGMYIPDTQRRVRRTASHSFKNGGMVQLVKFGYRKVSREEAAAGVAGPIGLRIAKCPQDTPVIRQMRDKVLQGDSYNTIARWLDECGIKPGPYAKLGYWTGRLVEDLLRNPLLSGLRQFGRIHSKLLFSSGKHQRKRNLNPETTYYSELAHLTPEEHKELIEVMDARNPRRGTERPHKRKGIPRKESYWPGQHLKCSICGDEMYWVSPTELKCQHARPGSNYSCWNQVLVNADEVRQKLLPQFMNVIRQDPELWQILIDAAWDEYHRTSAHAQRKLSDLERRRNDLESQSRTLAAAIARRPDLDALLDQLALVESDLNRVRREIETERSRLSLSCRWLTRADLEEQAVDAVQELARTSRTLGSVLSRLFPELRVVPIQAVDCPLVRPRVIWTLPAPTGDGSLDLVADAFEPSLPAKHAQACQVCREQHPDLSLAQLAERLGINRMAVKRALDYARRMQAAGLTEPYRVLTAPPVQASRWRKQSLQEGRQGHPPSDEPPP